MEEFDYCTTNTNDYHQQYTTFTNLAHIDTNSLINTNINKIITTSKKQNTNSSNTSNIIINRNTISNNNNNNNNHNITSDSNRNNDKLDTNKEEDDSVSAANVNIDIVNAVRNANNYNNNNNKRNINNTNQRNNNGQENNNNNNNIRINDNNRNDSKIDEHSSFTNFDAYKNGNLIGLDQLFKTTNLNSIQQTNNINNSNHHPTGSLMLLHQNIECFKQSSPTSLTNLSSINMNSGPQANNGLDTINYCNGTNTIITPPPSDSTGGNSNFSANDSNGPSHIFNQYTLKEEIQLLNSYNGLQLSTSPINQSSILLSPTSSTSSSVVPTSPIMLIDSRNNTNTLNAPNTIVQQQVVPINLNMSNEALIGSNSVSLINSSPISNSSASSVKSTSSSSSSLMGGNGGDSSAKRCRTAKKLIPDQAKDNKYFERRKRNNVAAKKSRDARKQREDEIAIRASFLEKENAILKAQLQTLKDEAQQLRILLAQKKSVNSCTNCSNCTASNMKPNPNPSINPNNTIHSHNNNNNNNNNNNTNNSNRLYSTTSYDNTDQLNAAKLSYHHHI